MALFRSLFFKSAEIAALAGIVVFLLYLLNSSSDADAILENEQGAQAILRELGRAERDYFQENDAYCCIDELRKESETLASLQVISLSNPGTAGLLRGEGYYFFLKLLFPKGSIRVERPRIPTGFRCIAWPERFSATGELCFYLDHAGKTAVSFNSEGRLNGLDLFPPDMNPARRAAEGATMEWEDWLKAENFHVSRDVFWETVQKFL